MRSAILTVVSVVILLSALSAHAQEQKPGQPLYFPKEQVKDRPMDLHMGSDPQYRPGVVERSGTDETGYEPYYDPSQIVVEEKTIYRRVDEEEESAPPPSRWQQ